MLASCDRRMMLRFAFLFAAVATALWAYREVGYSTSFLFVSTDDVYFGLNFGGQALAWQIPMLSDSYPHSATQWAWLVTAQFFGSFIQGLAYVLLGLVVLSTWPRSRFRAVAYPAVLALITAASFFAGVSHAQRGNDCGVVVDGIQLSEFSPDLLNCDLGFVDGSIWAAVAFGIALPTAVIIEMLIRRTSRTGSAQ